MIHQFQPVYFLVRVVTCPSLSSIVDRWPDTWMVWKSVLGMEEQTMIKKKGFL